MERYIVLRIMLAVFALFVIIFFVIRLASGGGDDDTIDDPQTSLLDQPLVLGEQVDTRSSVEFTIVGGIVADEDHRQIRYTITQNQRLIEIVQGYDGNVIDRQRLSNTPEAYAAFIYAIEEQGYTATKEKPTNTDRRGVCSDGRQFLYKVRVNGATRSDLWSTSCSSKQGPFGGDRSDIQRLFEKQFPDRREVTSGVDL